MQELLRAPQANTAVASALPATLQKQQSVTVKVICHLGLCEPAGGRGDVVVLDFLRLLGDNVLIEELSSKINNAPLGEPSRVVPQGLSRNLSGLPGRG